MSVLACSITHGLEHVCNTQLWSSKVSVDVAGTLKGLVFLEARRSCGLDAAEVAVAATFLQSSSAAFASS